MAEELGVDYDAAYFRRPTSNAEFAMNAMHCAEELICEFRDREGWPVDDFGRGTSKRQARRAAKYLRAALERKEGRDAISIAAQGYGRALASTWRAAATTGGNRDGAAQLVENAESSEKLADLVASIWPARGYEDVLERVALAETHRIFDPDDRDALVDLQDYARRARVTADALAVAMSARFDEFEDAIVGPVRALHIAHNVRLGATWNWVMWFWLNLCGESPTSQADVGHMLRSKAAQGDDSALAIP
jgi:hypothetical protein